MYRIHGRNLYIWSVFRMIGLNQKAILMKSTNIRGYEYIPYVGLKEGLSVTLRENGGIIKIGKGEKYRYVPLNKRNPPHIEGGRLYRFDMKKEKYLFFQKAWSGHYSDNDYIIVLFEGKIREHTSETLLSCDGWNLEVIDIGKYLCFQHGNKAVIISNPHGLAQKPDIEFV